MPRQHRHEYAAGFPRGLLGDQVHRRRSHQPHETTAGARCCPARIHQISSRFESYGGSTTGSLALRLSVSLAGPKPSGGTGPSRRCRGCSHPTLRLQGQAAPRFTELLRQPGGGDLHPTRFNSASWRTTRHSKSRVNSDPGRANGTLSVRAPCTRHHTRRRRQPTSSRQIPRSKCRQTESTGRLSFRARVEYPHSGQTSSRRRSATSTTTRSGSNRTFLTHTPGRRRSLENAVVTRTLSSSQAVDLQAASSLHGRAAARRQPTRNYQELPQAAKDLLRRRIPRSP